MGKDDFIFDWTRKLGFSQNPFGKKIKGPADKFFVGYEKERRKANLFVLENYPFGTITGDKGNGKSLFLNWISEKLIKHGAKVRVSYINASNLNKERDLIEGLVNPLLNPYEKAFSKPHKKIRLEEIGKFIHSKLKGEKRLLILLDNVGGLPKRYVPLFKYFFDNKMNVQLVVAGTKAEMIALDIEKIFSKDSLKINLKGLSLEESLEMLERRITHFGLEGIFPFQKDMIKRIHEKVKGNPRMLLKQCREKAIKLSLDKNYMKKETDKLEEIRRKRREEEMKKREEEEGPQKLISIKLGRDENEELPLKRLDAPGFDEQEELLAELVSGEAHKPVEVEQDITEEFHTVDDEPEEIEIKEDAPEEIPLEEPKEEKKEPEKEEEKKKPASKDETEELLSQLAREFEQG